MISTWAQVRLWPAFYSMVLRSEKLIKEPSLLMIFVKNSNIVFLPIMRTDRKMVRNMFFSLNMAAFLPKKLKDKFKTKKSKSFP